MDTIIQGSPEWHQLRLGKVTASRVSDCIAQIKTGEAASRSDYRIELVTERLTRIATEGFTNSHMMRGIELEPQARVAYELKNNLWVTEIAFVDHPTIAMSGASPDGLVVSDGMLEIKCPAPKTHIKYLLDGRVPAKYKNQMAWQMACTGRNWVDFMSFCPELPWNMQSFIIRYERDDDLIAELESKVNEFNNEVSEVIKRLKGL